VVYETRIQNYNIPSLPYSFASSYSNKTKGLLTATKVKVPGSTADFLWTVNYYDDEGRVVKTYRQHYLSGSVNAANYNEISNTYNFSGELTASTRVHGTTGGSTTIANRYEYDHMGRQLATMKEINGQGETVLSKLDYNEIGQLKTKNQGGAAGIPFLQSTNFGYNERGWMTTSTNSLFSMQLSYQENSSEQYNGNISKQSWGAGTHTSSAGVYSYGYDKLNRLLSAVSTGVVMSETIMYDVMGNIHTLKRDAGGANLYHYNGNRLDHAEYFTNIYAYDANGNATTDGRKSYNIQYNQLNLPSVVSNGINLSFVYDATGRKLRETSAAGTVNYVDGTQYKPNGTIDFIQTGEGVARSNAGGSYSYEYNLADHLGNNRVTYYKNPSNNQVEVIQRDNYYAFGLRKVALAGNNKYLYNGKELQSELGLYDYGARFYDPVIGRWNVIDPMAESYQHWSPYNYATNNPISVIDPDGRSTESITTRYVDPSGRTIFNSNDGRNDVYEVPWNRVGEFTENAKASSTSNTGQADSRGWNDYWRGQFAQTISEKTLKQAGFNFLSYENVQSAAIEYLYGSRSYGSFVFQEVKAQWSNPVNVAMGLTAFAHGMVGIVGNNAVKTLNPYQLEETHGLIMSRKGMAKLKTDISNNGIQETIKYVEYKGVNYIVDGHHRARVAKQMGLKQVPVQKVQLPYGSYRTVSDLQYSN
jgi:RHS repeat-associated protein